MIVKAARILCGIGAAICAAFLFLIMVSPIHEAYVLVWTTRTFENITHITITLQTSDLITTPLYSSIYFIPAALYGCLTCLAVAGHPRARQISLVSAGAVTILATALYGFSRHPSLLLLSIFIATALGSFACIGCLLLYGWLQKKLPAVFNRETVSYIVFGVLTTVVSFVSQMLFASLGTPAWLNTIGSWICAVTFAYVVNKLFVFESRTDTKAAFFRELWLFFAARLASLGMELVFMFVTVDLLHFSEAVCKLIAQVFILVANYIFSKLIIFKKQ